MKEPGMSQSPIQKADAAIKASIDQALWKDAVLRATDYYEIDVYVKNGDVYLSGHILGTTNQSRIEQAIHSVADIQGIKNNLVLDDRLTHEVAASLGELEHTHNCKFFTGVSHGVVSLNGSVANQNIKLLAERCAAEIPNVRGVINNVRVSGSDIKLHSQRFLQPIPGEIIYFLDGVFGTVKQVIINPNNRRVVAMTIFGKFADQMDKFSVLADATIPPREQLITIPMNVVRYLTKVSGFLYINSSEKNRYRDFEPGAFFIPNSDWIPPYPYCPEAVLIPIEHQNADLQSQSVEDINLLPFGAILEKASVRQEFFATDSFGL